MPSKRQQTQIKVLKAPHDSSGIRILRAFLTTTMKEFAKLNEKIYEVSDAYPFEYAELQVQPVVFSSFLNIGGTPYAERRIRRKQYGVPKRLGWVDFWVLYRNTVFLVEFKHAWCSFHSKTYRSWVLNDWAKAVKDVHSIREESLNELAVGKRGLFKLAMMTFRLEQKSESEDKVRVISEKEAVHQVKKLCESLNPAPGWIICWTLKEALQRERFEWQDNYWNYPAVYLCVWSEGPIDARS